MNLIYLPGGDIWEPTVTTLQQAIVLGIIMPNRRKHKAIEKDQKSTERTLGSLKLPVCSVPPPFLQDLG